MTIFGDYDVDGMTASSILYLYLQARGAKVRTYIPKRQGEGYGLNSEALEALYREGTTLVVTVDCGISGTKEVREAPAGMDIVITDHHRPPDELPPAYAVVNPNQRDCPYPFKGLSGVGVAFKLCQALEKLQYPDRPLWEGYTELVALGTVADIVPLRDENRALVRRGLKAMETTDLVGLRKLMEVSACPTEHITSENVGFILAPRLNAVGRLEHAQRAVELLTASDEDQAWAIAQELNQENALRQEISRTIFRKPKPCWRSSGKSGRPLSSPGKGGMPASLASWPAASWTSITVLSFCSASTGIRPKARAAASRPWICTMPSRTAAAI